MPFVLPGETVEASLREKKPGFARAQLDGILTPSPRRVDPRCPYFQRCGGCHYQHTDYEHQLEIKAAVLKENLRRIARLELDAELHVHASPPWNYRNRSRFKVQTTPEFALGYYKFNSHELLAVEECPISSPLINRGLAAAWQLGRAGSVSPGVQEIEFFANSDDTELLAEVYCLPEIATEPFTADLKLTLAEISSIVFFAARPAKAEGQGNPKLLGGSGNLTYCDQTGFLSCQRGIILPGQSPSDRPVGGYCCSPGRWAGRPPDSRRGCRRYGDCA